MPVRAPHWLCVLTLAAAGLAAPDATITLLPSGIAHTFTGHGGLSAGASSRLLQDYDPAIQSDILDLLFLPQHGMGLQLLKVEVGGDSQSTDGTEASHMHSRGDLSCTRGYELPLLKAARARNPAIKAYGLSWGAPAWINNGTYFGAEMVAYQAAWLTCMAQEGVPIDYIGVWSAWRAGGWLARAAPPSFPFSLSLSPSLAPRADERYWGGADYVKSLRAGLDAAGHGAVQIIIPDGNYDAAILQAAAADAAFNASFAGVGLHYPCDQPHAEVQAGGKLYWASEDWWAQPDWAGAGAWGHLLTQNYVRMNMTTTIAWSPLWSVYDSLNDEQAGIMLAAEPWSGHYAVTPGVWTSAQWLQFTAPGWRFLSTPSGGSGELPAGGYYVALVPPAGAAAPGLTLILETLGGARCASARRPAAPQTLRVTVPAAGGAPLPGPGAALQVWQTNASAQFVRLADALIAPDGSFEVTIAPDSMVTVSSVAGASKGQPRAPIPPSAPFPFPYADDFSGAAEDAQARFWADQFGSWAVRAGRLTQVAQANPARNGWSGDSDPLTLLGSSAWTDYAVRVTARAPPPPPPQQQQQRLRAPADGADALLLPCNASAAWQAWAWDAPAPGYLASGAPPSAGAPPQCLNVYGCATRIVLWECVTAGGSCCGSACYDGLKWARLPGNGSAGRLASALRGGAAGCVTAAGPPFSPSSALSLAPCAPALAPGQAFAFRSASAQVELAGSGLCLAAPPPPPPPPPPTHYARLCGRLGPFDGFRPGAPLAGYCLALRHEGGGGGQWEVVGPGGALLARGALAPPPAPGQDVALELAFAGASVSARIGGALVANVSDAGGRGSGRVALGSSFWPAAFAGFSVSAE